MTSTGDVLSDTRVVTDVTESDLTDDEIAFIRDDDVDVCFSVYWLLVFQPVHLQSHRHHQCWVAR